MRALLSVSNKKGIVEFARELRSLEIQIISTGGTHKKLAKEGITVTAIPEVTGFPECLDGRVKTLHPAVHGGILARRDKPEHMKQLFDLGIQSIDIVVINLYPFRETIRKPGVSMETVIENIDVGGPAMLRAAAKNHKGVVVICDPADYNQVIQELIENNAVSYETKYKLALKAFQHTAAYDAMIADYLRRKIDAPLPDNPTFSFEKTQNLRYGENPHQEASYYREIRPVSGTIATAEQLHGKELSFNNINDANGAVEALKEFQEPAVVAVKHANPCGVAIAPNILAAYQKAHDCDPTSIFGGIVAANREIDQATAEELHKIFIEIVIAPNFSLESMRILTQKPNIRLLRLRSVESEDVEKQMDIKKVGGGLLIQDVDSMLFDEAQLQIVTEKMPTDREKMDMVLAMKVAKHTKSNAIVLAKNQATIGIGPGQTNRIWAVQNAIRQSNQPVAGAVMASDAFFRVDDCVVAAAEAGITAIIQPGGSQNDQASIDKANELGIALIFSGLRHFKH